MSIEAFIAIASLLFAVAMCIVADAYNTRLQTSEKIREILTNKLASADEWSKAQADQLNQLREMEGFLWERLRYHRERGDKFEQRIKRAVYGLAFQMKQEKVIEILREP